MMKRFAHFACTASLILVACAHTTPTLDGEQDDALLTAAPFLGEWTSDLNGSTLTLEPTGIFGVNTPARNNKAATSTVGRWAFDGAQLTMMDLTDSGECADLPGIYKSEVVRDTVRFELVNDECLARQTLMAWPWKRSAVVSKTK